MFNLILLSFLAFFAFNPVFGVIIKVSDIEAFKEEIRALDEQSLVIFDVDETLLTPKDAFFRGTSNLSPSCKEILEHFSEMVFFLEEEILKEWKEIWISKICIKMDFQLVDAEFPVIIQQLQQKGIKTIALTAITWRSFGVIPSVAKWRTEQLKQFNIDFSHAFPNHPFLLLNLHNDILAFQDGVLFSDRSFKGESLHALLKAMNWIPSKILFIDDRLHNCESMAETCEALDISFVGFHYKAAEKISCVFDEKLTALRFRYLAETGNWLTEDEARRFFNVPVNACCRERLFLPQ